MLRIIQKAGIAVPWNFDCIIYFRGFLISPYGTALRRRDTGGIIELRLLKP